MKLYFVPNSRAVRTAWLLNEIGLDFEIERFQLGGPAMRSEEFRSINPNGRVPVLDDGDVRITESTAIAQYLVARYADGRFAPAPESSAYPTYLQWLHYGEGMIMGQVNNYMVETYFLPPERASTEHAKRAMKLLGRMLLAVDSHLEQHEYLAGEFSAADTITGHACIISEQLGADISNMPSLKDYCERLKDRPAYKKAIAL